MFSGVCSRVALQGSRRTMTGRPEHTSGGQTRGHQEAVGGSEDIRKVLRAAPASSRLPTVHAWYHRLAAYTLKTSTHARMSHVL